MLQSNLRKIFHLTFFQLIQLRENYNLPLVIWLKFKLLICGLKFDTLPT